MVDIDSETVLNVAAAILATVAVGFFVLNVDLGLSPVSTYALATGFLAGVFALTQRTDDRQLTALGYGVVVVSGVVVFFDLVSTFELGDAGTALGLLAIAAVLFVVRQGLDARSNLVGGGAATRAFAAVAVLAVVVLTVDVVTGGLAYELRSPPQVEIQSGGEEAQYRADLGTLVVSNPTPFPHEVTRPDLAVCTAGNWSAYAFERAEGPDRPVDSHLDLRIDYREYIWGFSGKRYTLTLNLYGSDLAGESFEVRRTDGCPADESGEPYLALYQRENSYREAVPVGLTADGTTPA